MKTTSNTGTKQYAFESAPRCGAKTKIHNGKPCLCPAIKGKNRCRLHGGAKGAGAKLGNKHALKHGHTTAQSKALKKKIRTTLNFNNELLKQIN